jgi:N-glycosylase/DNA lyase
LPKPQKSYKHVEQLRIDYSRKRPAIRLRLEQFAAVPTQEYFYELIYCVLTPQSKAVNAGKAIEEFKAQDFLHCDIDPVEILSRRQQYIRFHNTKAQHLSEFKRNYEIVRQHLQGGSTSEVLRAWLVENVKGLGWKESSHFLRNIGHRGLAILDRHILRNLKKHNVIRSLPKTLTAKRYLLIEEHFRQFAVEIGISMDELDLLFWSNETGEILK